MAATPSKMIPLGKPAPSFSLPDTVSGKTISLDDVASDKATVIFFICNHCPYVKLIAGGIAAIADHFQAKGVSFVAISSNDVENYPEDSPELMKQFAEENGYDFPYLYDEDQSVARAYDAACTPDLYVFDGARKLVYRGQFDEARPGNGEQVTGKDLRDALNAVLSGADVPTEQKPSIGCNIKWKSA